MGTMARCPRTFRAEQEVTDPSLLVHRTERMAQPWAGCNVPSTYAGRYSESDLAARVTREEAVSALNPLPHGVPRCPWVASGHGGTLQQTSMDDHRGRRMSPRVLQKASNSQGGSAPGESRQWRPAGALLQVDNDRVSIKLKLEAPQDRPSSRDERGYKRPWVLPSARHHSVSRSCHFGDLERKLGEPHSSAQEIRGTSDRVSRSSPAGRYGDEHLDGDGKHVDNEWPAERSGVPGGILSKTHGCVVDSSNGPWLSLSPARYVAVAILARSGNAMRHRQWPIAVGSGWWMAGRCWSVFGRLLCRREHWNGRTDGWGCTAWAELWGPPLQQVERLERERAAEPSLS